MRLVRLEVSGFRGFPFPREFDLDADAVILVANNGIGKTSMLDAILWGLTGSIPRLGGAPDKLKSLFSSTGQMHVGVTLRDESGTQIRVDRMYDGRTVSLSFADGGKVFRDDSASARLLQALNANEFSSDGRELAKWLTRTVYLQQDQISDFVSADTEAERFNTAAAVLGLSDVADFQTALDRARTSWTTATNQLDRDLQPLRTRVERLASEANALSGKESAVEQNLIDRVRSWAAELSAAVPEAPTQENVDAPALETALKVLAQQQRLTRSQLERRRHLAGRIASFQEERQSVDPADLEDSLASLEQQFSVARQSLSEAETLAASEHRRALATERQRTELQALAELALRHLGNSCPVCAQEIDQESVATDLQRRLDLPTEVPALTAELLVRERAETASRLESEVGRLRQDLRLARQERSQRDEELAGLKNELASLNVAGDSLQESARRLAVQIPEDESSVEHFDDLQARGERFLLSMSTLIRQQRLSEVRRQLEEQQAVLAARTEELTDRSLTGDVASTVLQQVRAETDALMADRLQGLVPFVQRVFSAIDPHPDFRVVQFVSAIRNRRGRLNPMVQDPVSGAESLEPYVVLSNSQTSALAISLFIGMNLGASQLPLQACLLDDPLQNLDEVHLLGLVDVLRRLKKSRQVLITTHDKKFASLLARKMRPVQSGRTVVIRLGDQVRAGIGPVLEEIEPDRAPLKFAG